MAEMGKTPSAQSEDDKQQQRRRGAVEEKGKALEEEEDNRITVSGGDDTIEIEDKHQKRAVAASEEKGKTLEEEEENNRISSNSSHGAVEFEDKQQQRAAAASEEKGKALEEEEDNIIPASGGDGAIKIEDKQQQRAAAALEEKGKALGEEEEDDRKTTSGGGDVGDGKQKDLEGVASAAVVLHPSDIVEEEVLTRLPIKSLMRFKCVSKLWCSTISHPCFSKARYSAASGLFIITYPCSDDSSSSLRCFYATLPHSRPRPPPIDGQGGEEVVVKESQLLHQGQYHQFTSLPLCKYMYKYSGATHVINGLFCLFADNHAWVCSITTGEVRELPASPDPNIIYHIATITAFKYYFGFVSTCNEYKLLRVCSMEGHLQQDCMILTLGKDPSWISYDDPVPVIDMAGDAVYIDGTLYCRSGCALYSRDIIAFNFQDEIFYVIPLPPRDESSLVLLQCRGHLAVAQEKRSYQIANEIRGGVARIFVSPKLELWELEQSTPSSYEWVYHVIDIPSDFPVDGFRLLCNLPHAGEMLLSGFATDKSIVPVYSYDHTTGKFEKFVIGKFPSSPGPSVAPVCKDTSMLQVYYYEEDITPLNDLIPIVGKKKQQNKKGSRAATPNAYGHDIFPLGLSLSFCYNLLKCFES